MRDSRRWVWVDSALGWVYWWTAVPLVVVTASLYADTAQWDSELAARAVDWMQAWSVISLPVLAGASALAGIVQRRTGQPAVWQAIHSVLDELRDLVLRGRSGAQDHHRVTLFQARRSWPPWTWPPWALCLVPVARSGHMTRQSGTCFRIPNQSDDVEGVAGRAWAMRGTFAVDGLPDPNPATATEEELQTYAEGTFVNMAWVRKRRHPERLARSYLAIPVEVKGEPWGVIVLDSRDPGPIGRDAKRVYNSLAKVLEALLERGLR